MRHCRLIRIQHRPLLAHRRASSRLLGSVRSVSSDGAALLRFWSPAASTAPASMPPAVSRRRGQSCDQSSPMVVMVMVSSWSSLYWKVLTPGNKLLKVMASIAPATT